jgi:chromosome segregation ATPase
MLNGLWWLPSLVVFGTAALAVVLAVRTLRSRQRKQGIDPVSTRAALEQSAGVELVRADDLLRNAEDEVEFARAQFGDRAAADLAAVVSAARDQLREAFHLHQQLHDAVPDSDAQRRRWSQRIVELCSTISETIQAETAQLDSRRALERSAPEQLAELDRVIAETEERIAEAEATLDRLSESYAPNTYSRVESAPTAAAEFVAAARTTLEAARQRVAQSDSAAEVLETASTQLQSARHTLDSVSRTASGLDSANAELATVVAQTRRAVSEATAERDAAPIPESADEISRALDVVAATIALVTDRRQLPDPLTRLDELRDSVSRLDAALASARSSQQRIDNAREAMRGALFSARSHLDVARGFIEDNRGCVGADARTRLAEAERQLALAEAADDPVDALDTARRVSRLAQDADALARYDAGPRTAPLKR